jgi:hypothetical protein
LRKAIALFLTLIFMIIVLGIVGAVIGIYKEVSKNTFEKDISQNSVLIINIKSVLDKFVKDINGSDIKNIYGVFPATNKDGTFKVLITIKPIMDKINLNEYVKKDKEKIIDTFFYLKENDYLVIVIIRIAHRKEVY